MIFRRRKKADEVEAEEPQADEAETDETQADEDDEPAESADSGELDEDALDRQDWRTDGPWDISEVDLEAESDESPRIDLGSLIISGFPGAELRLQVAEETQQLVSAMLINGDSAIEIGAYAGPRTGGFWAEQREEIAEAVTGDGGSVALAAGPFGVELRRLMPVTTPDGEQGYQPSTMWVVEGPRWLLRGIIYGRAAMEEGTDGPVADLLAAFRNVVVRRGDEAMAPGDQLPLSLPVELAEPEEE